MKGGIISGGLLILILLPLLSGEVTGTTLTSPSIESAVNKMTLLKEEALDRGLRLPEYASLYIIKKAEPSIEDMEELIRLDSSLPHNYFKISELYFKKGLKEGVVNGVPYLLSGFNVALKDFNWVVNLLVLFSGIALSGLLIALIITALLRTPLEIPLLIHEIAEKRISYAFIGLIILSAFAGIPYLALSILLLSAIHIRTRGAKVLVGLFSLFLMSLPFILQIEERLIRIISDPEVRAVRDVNSMRDNRFILSLPGGERAVTITSPSKDFAFEFSKALALKREGRIDEALKIFRDLAETHKDYRVFNNLGNCLFLKGNIDEAVSYYNKALDLKINPQSLFNLSQASKERLEFEKGKQYYEEAMKLDSDLISQFTRISSKVPNRFLMDITLDTGDLLRFGLSREKGSVASILRRDFLDILIPLLLLGLLFIKVPVVAYRCSRCGRIICNLCQKKELWGRMCPECYDVLVSPDRTDSKMRLQRLLYLQKKKELRKRIFWISSLLPGGPQIAQGWIVYGFVIHLSLVTGVIMFFAGRFYTIEDVRQFYLTGIGLLLVITGVLIHLLTLFSGEVTVRRVSRRWA